jgi:hypothetical protein
LSGKIVDESGQPVSAAQVTIDLIDGDPHAVQSFLNRWETKTDAEGRYTVDRLSPLHDPCWFWLIVRVSAQGFVDLEPPGVSLKRLLGVNPGVGRFDDLRLLRGVRLQGRVLGADGTPVGEAALFALSATAKDGMEPGVSGGLMQHRLRRTDKGGRFEFCAPPGMSIDLVIQCDHWAPKRILIPAEQTDAGDIRLERGTSVTGTLKSGHGVPLPGYWILAESCDLGLFPSALHPIKLTAKTDAAGCFRLPPLKGRFKIRVADSVQVWWTEPQVQSLAPKLAFLPQDYTFDGSNDSVEIHLRAAPQARISGRILTLYSQPARRERIVIYCNAKTPERQVMLDSTWTDEEGRYAFQGIPRGVKEVFISGTCVYPWKAGTNVYLKMCSLPGVPGARNDGMVYLDELKQNLTNVDFQFRLWNNGQFLERSPE